MSDTEKLPSAAVRAAVWDYLHGLPEAPFASDLSQRLQMRTRSALTRSSRITRWARATVAAALLLMLLLPGSRLAWHPDEVARCAPCEPGSAVVSASDADAIRDRVRALDRELRMSIQRGDSAATRSALWAERDAVVAQLSSSTPFRPARI